MEGRGKGECSRMYIIDWFLIPRDTFEHSQVHVGENLTLFKLVGLRADETCIISDSTLSSVLLVQEAWGSLGYSSVRNFFYTLLAPWLTIFSYYGQLTYFTVSNCLSSFWSDRNSGLEIPWITANPRLIHHVDVLIGESNSRRPNILGVNSHPHWEAPGRQGLYLKHFWVLTT